MDALGIERSDVEKAISRGMKWKEKNSEKWHANMASIECVFLKNNINRILMVAFGVMQKPLIK